MPMGTGNSNTVCCIFDIDIDIDKKNNIREDEYHGS